jgi:hypothetical protein
MTQNDAEEVKVNIFVNCVLSTRRFSVPRLQLGIGRELKNTFQASRLLRFNIAVRVITFRGGGGGEIAFRICKMEYLSDNKK